MSDQTVLCTEFTSTVSNDRLYESSSDDFGDAYALNRRDECADWFSRDDMVSQVCSVFFVVFVLWFLFLVTVVLMVLFF
jgi:hypothetical protein